MTNAQRCPPNRGNSSDELPEELKRREDRLAAIRAARARLEAEARERDDARGREPEWDRNPKGGSPYKLAYGEPEAKAQTNFTDPESRIMRTSTEGYQQCYNAQAVVDGESQLVVGTGVTDNASDQGQLVERVDEVSGRLGETPGEVLADAGYSNEEDLAALDARGIDGYVALGREGKGAGKPDPKKLPATARMAKKLETPQGRAVYAKRKWIAEAPIGWVKEAMGFRRFSLRGLENVRGEWDLVCLALNARRLHVLRAAGGAKSSRRRASGARNAAGSTRKRRRRGGFARATAAPADNRRPSAPGRPRFPGSAAPRDPSTAQAPRLIGGNRRAGTRCLSLVT